MQYADEHIQFVSNLTGTTVGELFLIVSLTQLVAALTPLLLSFGYGGLFQLKHSWQVLSAEFFLLVVPVIACITWLSDYITLVWAALSCILVTFAAVLHFVRSKSGSSRVWRPPLASGSPAFVSNLRGTIHLYTAVCILAVDFRVFPRRLAKTETFGVGLMDLAVGCFVITHGLTTAPGVRRSARSAAVLGALAVSRLAMVKLVGYHEHVSEYGVHWNFFATLCLVRLIGAPLAGRGRTAAAAALALAALQQHLLTDRGLQTWITDEAPRRSLLESNREALVSLPGFLALFAAGCALRHALLERRLNSSNSRLLAASCALLLAAAAAARLVQLGGLAISRRLANAPYLLICVGTETLLLGGFLLVEGWLMMFQRAGCLSISFDALTPHILRLCNRHGLLLFCLANVMTGMINMAVPTIHCSDSVAIAIIVAYTSGLLYTLVRYDRGLSHSSEITTGKHTNL